MFPPSLPGPSTLCWSLRMEPGARARLQAAERTGACFHFRVQVGRGREGSEMPPLPFPPLSPLFPGSLEASSWKCPGEERGTVSTPSPLCLLNRCKDTPGKPPSVSTILPLRVSSPIPSRLHASFPRISRASAPLPRPISGYLPPIAPALNISGLTQVKHELPSTLW